MLVAGWVLALWSLCGMLLAEEDDEVLPVLLEALWSGVVLLLDAPGVVLLLDAL